MNLSKRSMTLSLTQGGVPVPPLERSDLFQSLNEDFANLEKGSLVFLLEKSPLRFLHAFLAALDRGLVPIATPSETTPYQLDQMKKGLPGSHAYINGELQQSKGSTSSTFSDSYACLTSGTTGIPKLCYLKVENALSNAREHAKSLKLESSHTLIQTLPLYHSFGIVSYIFAWLEKEFTLDINPVFLGLKTLSKRKLEKTIIHISPSQLRFMLKEKTPAPAGIEIISVGGGSIDKESLESFLEKFTNVKLYTTYGLTEAGPRVSSGKWSGQNTGFIGRGLESVEVAVLVNNEIRSSGEGKLLLRSPCLKVNLSVDELKDGHLITRDHVKVDSEGNIYFLGREDDLINVGGISIYPLDIETVVKSHRSVIDAIVIKKKSRLYEEEPLLVVEPEIDVKDLREFLKDKLSVHQLPKSIISLKKLPRNSLEKVDRKKLKLLLEME